MGFCDVFEARIASIIRVTELDLGSHCSRNRPMYTARCESPKDDHYFNNTSCGPFEVNFLIFALNN